MTVTFALSSEELKLFHERGKAAPFTLCWPEEINELWKRERVKLLDRTAAVYPDGPASGVTNIADYDRHLDNDFLANHIRRPKIVARVASSLGPDGLWDSVEQQILLSIPKGAELRRERVADR